MIHNGHGIIQLALVKISPFGSAFGRASDANSFPNPDMYVSSVFCACSVVMVMMWTGSRRTGSKLRVSWMEIHFCSATFTSYNSCKLKIAQRFSKEKRVIAKKETEVISGRMF